MVVDKCKLSELDKAKHTLREWAQSPKRLRSFKLICQPFASKEELERSVIGENSRRVNTLMKTELEVLSLPRLQLRGIARLELSSNGGYVRECARLLTSLR